MEMRSPGSTAAISRQAERKITQNLKFLPTRVNLYAVSAGVQFPAGQQEVLMDTGSLVPGQWILSRWQVTSFIGRGAIGEVYATRDMVTGQEAALKLFRPEVGAGKDAWMGFQQIARAASSVPYVARATEFGHDPATQRAFVVSEFVRVPSLESLLKAGPLGFDTWIEVLQRLRQLLSQAHQAGFAHRVLHPRNIFFDPKAPETLRVTDFGTSALRLGLASSHVWASEPGFSGPDALDPNARGTIAMDVYSVGVMTFAAFTGASPFRAAPTDLTALWQEASQPLQPAAQRARELGQSLPQELDAWFARALAPQPDARFPSIADMVKELETLLQAGSRTAGGPLGVALATTQPLVFIPNLPERRPELLAQPQAHAYAPQYDPSSAPLAAPGYGPPILDPSGMPPGFGGQPGYAPSMAPQGYAPAGYSEDPPQIPTSNTPMLVATVGGIVVAALAIGGLAYWLWPKSDAEARAAASASAAASSAPPTAPSAAPATSAPEPAPTTEADAGTGPSTDVILGTVRLSCNPACETLFCDARPVDLAKAEVQLVPGEHTCRGGRRGYQPKYKTFTIAAGEVRNEKFELVVKTADKTSKASKKR
jgi:hypothetical protein